MQKRAITEAERFLRRIGVTHVFRQYPDTPPEKIALSDIRASNIAYAPPGNDNAHGDIKFATGANIYWQVQETVEDFAKAKASKADMVAANWAYSDLDNALTTDAEDAILAFPIPPSFVTMTGGGFHPFWRIARTTDLARVERLNKRLALHFGDVGGDEVVFNRDRIMRAPWTVNYPNKKKAATGRLPILSHVSVGDLDRVLNIADLEAALDELEKRPQKAKGNRSGVETPSDTSDLSEAAERARTQGLHVDGTSYDGRRSDALFPIVKAGVAAGQTDMQIYDQIMKPDTWGPLRDTIADHPEKWIWDQIAQIRDKAPEEPPTAGEGEDKTPVASEDHMAIELIKEHGQNFRIIGNLGRTMLWTGSHWVPDQRTSLFAKARRIVRKFALRSNKGHNIARANVVAAVARLAGSDPRVTTDIEQWDVKHDAVSTPTKRIDTRTGKLSEPLREDYSTRCLKVDPVDDDCPNWRGFLELVTAGDRELQEYLQKLFGYFLTGDVSEQSVWLFIGEGGNGKSIVIKVLMAILGRYAEIAPTSLFTLQKYEKHETEVAKLWGCRLAVASETKQGAVLDEERIKSLTGGDRLTGRFMAKDFFDFPATHKLLIITNHPPAIRTPDEAIARRVKYVPFNVTVKNVLAEKGEEVNLLFFEEKLEPELGAILHWMIEGLALRRRDGMKPPAAVLEATAEYLESEDKVGEWLKETFVERPGARIDIKEVYARWKSSEIEAGANWIGNSKWLIAKLRTKHFEVKKSNGKKWVYGIEIQL